MLATLEFALNAERNRCREAQLETMPCFRHPYGYRVTLSLQA
jgi:hypothetical protein